MRNQIKTIIAASLMMVASPSFASEKAINIFTGVEGGGYDTFTQSLMKELDVAFDISYTNLDGSSDIADAICNNATPSFGPAQVDALYVNRDSCDFQIIGKYPLQEYAMILFPPNSDMDELSDLDENSKIAVDSKGSGTGLFVRNIMNIEKEHGRGNDWSNAEIVEVIPELLDVGAEAGEFQAVIFVTSTNSKTVLGLIESGWELGSLYDKDINDQQFNGRNLYEYEEVEFEFPGLWNDLSADAYTVQTYIITSKQGHVKNPKITQRIARALK